MQLDTILTRSLSACAHGHYGVDCVNVCSGNCRDGEPCNFISGNCDNGCKVGYYESNNCTQGEKCFK